jgi:glycosyltransferase involved in cell wall biosynthesis
MTRVLHLYSDRNWTGSAEPVVNLCRELGSQFSVTLIHGTHKNKPVRIAPLAAKYGVSLDSPLYLRKHPHFIRSLIDIRRLVSYMKVHDIQLLHVHRLGDHIIGGPSARTNATPLLRTIHSEATNLGFREKLLLTRFTDGIIVPNEEAKANILRQLESLRARIWVVPSAIDTLRFNPERVARESVRRKLGISPDEYVIGIVSRIRSSRKVDLAVEAFGIAHEKLPRLRLVIAGWGKTRNIKECISDPVQRFGIADRVIHLGYVEGESYVEALAATDAGVYLVPGSDKTCRTVLEFMAMGKPVIIGKQGILSGLIQDTENGVAVECKAEKIAEAIVRLASDPCLSEKMGEKSLERVSARFSLNLQAAAISKIYGLFLSSIFCVESL